MNDEYDDIIHLSHLDPKHHSRMSLEARAAQFAPFSALTGHKAVLAESARYTELNPELDDHQCSELNRSVSELLERLNERPMIIFTLFEKDTKKSGGHYREVIGIVSKFDEFEKIFILEDRQRIMLTSIIGIRYFTQEFNSI